jgi:cytochrome c
VAGRHVVVEAAVRKVFTFVILLSFFFSLGTLLAQNTAPSACSNPEAVAKMVNPVKPTTESLTLGKKYYGYDCAMCHGTTGNGKGDVEPGEKLPDFTNSNSLKDKSDGQLFCSLKMGKGHMPIEPARTSENDLWSLVNYVRSLSK